MLGIVMLSFTFLKITEDVLCEGHNAECRNAECNRSECNSSECCVFIVKPLLLGMVNAILSVILVNFHNG
jgi:hypothetical protein